MNICHQMSEYGEGRRTPRFWHTSVLGPAWSAYTSAGRLGWRHYLHAGLSFRSRLPRPPSELRATILKELTDCHNVIAKTHAQANFAHAVGPSNFPPALFSHSAIAARGRMYRFPHLMCGISPRLSASRVER